MRSLNPDDIIFDQSWTNEYDKYLARFNFDYSKDKGSSILGPLTHANKEISHNLMFNTTFHVAKLKRPVIGIYKRPI